MSKKKNDELYIMTEKELDDLKLWKMELTEEILGLDDLLPTLTGVEKQECEKLIKEDLFYLDAVEQHIKLGEKDVERTKARESVLAKIHTEKEQPKPKLSKPKSVKESKGDVRRIIL
jgi:hypothetical protein